MLPVLEVLSFDRVIEDGGRNKPWLVQVRTENGLDSYVLKLFSPREKGSEFALNREIFAHEIACQCDLSVPEVALLHLSEPFSLTIPDALRQVFLERRTEYAFGCRFYDGPLTFSPSLAAQKLQNYDLESIFAFDAVIRNVDRRLPKPNILLFEGSYLLIDHELSLELTSEMDAIHIFNNYPFFNHVFYGLLKAKNARGKLDDFATFRETFRFANFNHLEELAEDLQQYGIETPYLHHILRYLSSCQTQIDTLINILKTQLS